ncbi:hypothetical protein AB0L88_02940 [Saccharopolyspora shandongensis]|uniref:hypothetical protein n=1 Tax=Saccharopolyspora shandongensis TaxID=418495 RepID=UPI00342B340F
MTRRFNRTRLLLLAVAVVLLAYLVGAQVLTQVRANEQADQRDQAQQQAAESAQDARAVADPLAELCRTDPTVAARVGDACKVAAEVRQEPAPPAVSRAEIAAAVADYLRRNPPPAGRSATLDQITTAVAEYLTTTPPQPGRPPSAAEISAAVAAYITGNPPPAGRDGADGEPGRPPTAEEIDAAVARYFAENLPPSGPPGPQGEQGEPGPTCPPGYELRPVLLLAPNGGTYDGIGCVDGPATPGTPSTEDSKPTTLPTR